MRLHDEAAPHCGGQTLLRASLHRCSRAAGCWCQGVQAQKRGAQHPQCHHEARKGKGRNIIIHVHLKKTRFMSMRTGETPPSATRKPSSFTTSSSTSCRLRPCAPLLFSFYLQDSLYYIISNDLLLCLVKRLNTRPLLPFQVQERALQQAGHIRLPLPKARPLFSL